MAKLKLDLHEIFNDGARIEAALAGIVREAEEKRIEEVEIIPGKGSGALKKSVLRFLERPEVKGKYHRVVKDGDNWGRLFVYFRWGSPSPPRKPVPEAPKRYACFCCGALNPFQLDGLEAEVRKECPGCGSPNRIRRTRSGDGGGFIVEPGYE